MSSPPILIVEDTQSLSLFYTATLRKAHYEVELAQSYAEGQAAFGRIAPRVVLMDLKLPDGSGMDLMAEFLLKCPETRVIVITADGSISNAVEAMRAGAHEFLVKPFDDRRLVQAVSNALCAREAAAHLPARDLPATAPPGAFIGTSEAMRTVYARIHSVARSMATVFITGESGTGKELCAQAVHRSSPRAKGPFIALNCGAIPSDLMESEVFGHVKGSFTGAIADKQGAAAAADGGTLFLDEICEMDMALQTKLLRFLQTATIQPVGATRPRKVDVRILCATNRDPQDAMRAGRFREDLYYRLHVVPIHLPPLRDRGADILEIAEKTLATYAMEEGKTFTGLDEEVRAIFAQHSWPGNVRQLLNTIRNVVVLNEGPLVTRAMLPTDLYRAPGGNTGSDTGTTPRHDSQRATGPQGPARDVAGADHAVSGHAASGQSGATSGQQAIDALTGRSLAEVEQMLIESTIARCGGSVPRAAHILDVAPSTIYRKRDTWAHRNDTPPRKDVTAAK
ncbi:MAG: sigma-54-dependent Fis family transcriptional regulator [Rhodobacteraceae bacterium]|nr:sigma-54-dependent Fis family transcriptional regulator [Paracoccaceae bacterium]